MQRAVSKFSFNAFRVSFCTSSSLPGYSTVSRKLIIRLSKVSEEDMSMLSPMLLSLENANNKAEKLSQCNNAHRQRN